MPRNKVVSREDWFEAHKAHLAREKELTRFRDASPPSAGNCPG